MAGKGKSKPKSFRVQRRVLDNPRFQQVVLNNIANTGMVEGCTRGVPSKSRNGWLTQGAFYAYCKDHPEFQAKVIAAQETFSLKFPEKNPEYWRMADATLKKYLTEGNVRRHTQTEFKPPDHEGGHPTVTKVVKNEYHNGPPRWVLEKVWGRRLTLAAQVSVIVANQLKLLSTMPTLSAEQRQTIVDFLTFSQAEIEKRLTLLKEE